MVSRHPARWGFYLGDVGRQALLLCYGDGGLEDTTTYAAGIQPGSNAMVQSEYLTRLLLWSD